MGIFKLQTTRLPSYTKIIIFPWFLEKHGQKFGKNRKNRTKTLKNLIKIKRGVNPYNRGNEMKNMKLEVIYLPTDALTPYKNNAKLHPQEQIDQIKKSITEFGMNDPIAVWGENNLIVEGHGRLIACQQLGFKEVPVIRLDDLTEDERKAYTLTHNKLTMNTDFDLDILNVELGDIDLDMGDFGFDEFNFDSEEDKSDSQTIESGKEVDLDEYSDDKFKVICPKCGFGFNPKEGE